jgi:Fe-S cluster assembly protein SufB
MQEIFQSVTHLLIGNKCHAHTYPYHEIRNSSANIEHEATTSKISDEQLFYISQRGIVKKMQLL